MDTQVTVILLIVFLGLSAFFSSAETAFFALQRVRLQHLVAIGAPRAARVQRMKEHSGRFLATILLGNNLANIAISALATNLAISILGDDRRGLSVAAAIGAGTVVVVIFGETAPKTLSAHFPERLAFFYVRPLEFIEKLLWPLAAALGAVSAVLIRPFTKSAPVTWSLSEEELRMLVTVGAREGVVEAAQAEIIKKAFRLGDLWAREIMTPRTDILWVPQDATLAQFLKVYAQETHTRFPVYQDDPDNVIGVLYIKDVMKAVAEGKLKDDDPVAPLLRQAHFYPETKPVDDLFVEMRTKGTQMVFLVNEFGTIAGLLTLKQIVGEIVGRIREPEAEPVFETIDERTVQVDASMRVDEANEHLKLGLPDGDYETLAGFVLACLGRVPREGEHLQYDGLHFVVSEMKGVKIERILVKRP